MIKTRDMGNPSIAGTVMALYRDALLATDFILANASLFATTTLKPKFEAINNKFRGVSDQVKAITAPPPTG